MFIKHSLVLASEFSVESLYINSFAGERHDCFLKYSKGGHQWKFQIHVVPPLKFFEKNHGAPQQNYLYTGILH